MQAVVEKNASGTNSTQNAPEGHHIELAPSQNPT